MKRLVVGTVALIGLTGAANAAYVPTTWSDEITGTHYIAPGGSYSYTHTLDGFKPLDDIITNFSLAIDLYDDSTRDLFEIADIDISGEHGGYVTSFNFGNDAFKTGWTLSGIIELNLLGTLSVTVNSVCSLAVLTCGDFNLGTSTLVAKGYTQQVPEPGTIALLGLGLLGVGLSRRKRVTQ